LGRLLAGLERKRVAGPGRGKVGGKTITHDEKSFLAYLKEVGLDKGTAVRAQRIGSLPDAELAKALAQARERDSLLYYEELLILARPYWYQANRKRKHRKIRAVAAAVAEETKAVIGPFPLILADPPWRFAVYSEKGLERTPDQHYPTLTYQEIGGMMAEQNTTVGMAPAGRPKIGMDRIPNYSDARRCRN
jgi:hypothetical protein